MKALLTLPFNFCHVIQVDRDSLRRICEILKPQEELLRLAVVDFDRTGFSHREHYESNERIAELVEFEWKGRKCDLINGISIIVRYAFHSLRDKMNWEHEAFRSTIRTPARELVVSKQDEKHYREIWLDVGGRLYGEEQLMIAHWFDPIWIRISDMQAPWCTSPRIGEWNTYISNLSKSGLRDKGLLHDLIKESVILIRENPKNPSIPLNLEEKANLLNELAALKEERRRRRGIPNPLPESECTKLVWTGSPYDPKDFLDYHPVIPFL